MAYDIFPQAVIPTNSCIEVTQHDKLVRTWDTQDGAGELVVECGHVIIFRCKCRGKHRYQGEEAFLDEWDSDSHYLLIDYGWDKVVMVYKLGSDGKAYAMDAQVFCAFPFPEDGVVWSDFSDYPIFS